MESFIHADIFFVVTTASVILLSIGGIIALVFIIKILNNIHKISRVIHTESNLITEDIHELRETAHRGNLTAGDIFHFFRNLFKRRGGRAK